MDVKPNARYNIMAFLKALKDKEVTAEGLDSHTRRRCVEYLLQETNNTQTMMGYMLGVNRSTIHRDILLLRAISMKTIAPFETGVEAKELIFDARILLTRARKAGDIRLEWRIRKDLTEQLGKMGLITWKAGGDIVLGNKTETNVTSVQSSTKQIFNAMSPEQRDKLSQAFREAGLVKGAADETQSSTGSIKKKNKRRGKGGARATESEKRSQKSGALGVSGARTPRSSENARSK